MSVWQQNQHNIYPHMLLLTMHTCPLCMWCVSCWLDLSSCWLCDPADASLFGIGPHSAHHHITPPSTVVTCQLCVLFRNGANLCFFFFFCSRTKKKKTESTILTLNAIRRTQKNKKNICLNATIGCSGSIIYCWSNYCSIHYTARGRAGRSITRNVACQSSECEANKNEIEEE